MMIRRLLTLVLMLGLASVARLNAATIPAGTSVTVRTSSSLSSGSAHAGDTWEGSLQKDVVVNGHRVARAGDPVKGTVTLAKSSGRLHAPGQLSIRLSSIGGQAVSSSRYSRTGKSHTKSNVTKIGGGAAAGALVGALVGGGKGAAIGAGAGGAAGTGVAAATGKQEAVIGSESLLTFTITSSR